MSFRLSINARFEIFMLLPLALISTTTLALEVLLTKFLSYSVSQMLVYMVLGIAMLGFGAAGSLVAVRTNWIEKERVPKVTAWASLIFVISIIVCYAIFVRLTPLMTVNGWVAFSTSCLLGIPFLVAGTVITLAISSAGRYLPAYYAVNLVGSGIGCFIPVLLLGPLTGQQLLVFLALLGWCATLFYLRLTRLPFISVFSLATWGTLGLLIVVFVTAESVIPVEPEPAPFGQLGVLLDYSKEHRITAKKRYDRWNVTGRIEVFELDNVPDTTIIPYPYMLYAHDSSGISTLTRWDRTSNRDARSDQSELKTNVPRFCSESLYGLGYFVPRPKVMIIGLGGAPDVQCAIYFKSKHIDVAEINPDAIEAIRGPFDEWLGSNNDYPGLYYHNIDGRSFVHNTRGKQYDLIQLSGADTKQILVSGSLTLSENYLYTKEAFVDYLKSLSPTGIISIIRFGEVEALRLANTAIAALRELGVTNPANHIAVYYTSVNCGVIVRRTGFTRASADKLRESAEYTGRLAMPFFYRVVHLFEYSVSLKYRPFRPSTGVIGDFFESIKHGAEDFFVDTYAWNITPAVDDKPFFFDYSAYDRIETWILSPYIRFMIKLVASIFILSIVLILLPVIRMRGRLKGGNAIIVPFYFVCVGLAYLLVEVWMLHRFSMFLGHQTYGLSVVPSTLLISTGLGAWLSPWIIPHFDIRVLVGCGAILLFLTSGLFILPYFLVQTWHLGLLTRVLVVMSFIVPTGVAMGFPFPAGLSWLNKAYPTTVPWCVGINGFASVMATIIAVPIALCLGYTAVLQIGIVLYVLAAFLFCIVPKNETRP